ncbi:MAG: hypothetical protein HPM95_10545 [Alphaproteobacteria bacterium]|nr:hypothetical protein [Alphaproteobacteria bacterium]
MKLTRGKDTRIATGSAELPCYEVYPPHPASERPTGRIVLLQEIFGTPYAKQRDYTDRRWKVT